MSLPRESSRQRDGYAAEQLALDYLLARGLRLLERNYRVRVGELDLIMMHGSELVIVEVRKRSSTQFGGAVASVGSAKQLRLRRAAQAFLSARFGTGSWPPVRFDVFAIDAGRIHWISAAF
jgi:putative endonuclease